MYVYSTLYVFRYPSMNTVLAAFTAAREVTASRKWAMHITAADLDLISVMSTSLQQFPTIHSFIVWCQVVSNLKAVRNLRTKLKNSDSLPLLIVAVQHDSVAVRAAACHCISTLASDPLLAKSLLDLGVAVCVCECLKPFAGRERKMTLDPAYLQPVLLAISSLAINAAIDLGDSGCCEGILRIIYTYFDVPPVLAAAFQACRELSVTCVQNLQRLRHLEKMFVVQAMIEHGEDKTVWEHGLGLLAVMISKSYSPPSGGLASSNHEFARVEVNVNAASTDGPDADLCCVLLKAFQYNAQNKEIILNACWCIMAVADFDKQTLSLLSTTGRMHLAQLYYLLQNFLFIQLIIVYFDIPRSRLNTGLCELIINTLKLHLKTAIIAENCCRVICSMLNDERYGDQNNERFIEAGALETLSAGLLIADTQWEYLRWISLALSQLLGMSDLILLSDRISQTGTFEGLAGICMRLLSSISVCPETTLLSLLDLLTILMRSNCLAHKDLDTRVAVMSLVDALSKLTAESSVSTGLVSRTLQDAAERSRKAIIENEFSRKYVSGYKLPTRNEIEK